MTKELSKTLTTALVQWIDKNRPEGSLCCSNTECERIEKAFEGGLFDVVEKTIKKKLSGLTEFEESLRQIIVKALSGETPNGSGGTMSWTVALSDDDIKKLAPKVLALAKKELLGKWNEDMKDEYARGKRDGLTIGYNKAMKEYNESVAYHFPIMPTTPSGWGCDGTYCTNPHFDCINCPRQFTGNGKGTITTPNTSSGTSTAALHGNTSATDGKEHNPSFTD